MVRVRFCCRHTRSSVRGVNLSIHREREEGYDHLDDPRSGRALALGHGVRAAFNGTRQ